MTRVDDINRLFCQHCKTLQKTNKTIVECWYNPLTEEGRQAFCEANIDACKEIKALYSQPSGELRGKKRIFSKAVKAWGVDAQVMMLFEEMAELQKALCKMRRNGYRWGTGDALKECWENLAEEVADVSLMLEQIEDMFEISRTEERKEQKLLKLEALLPIEDKK